MTTATICRSGINFNAHMGSKAVSGDYQIIEQRITEAVRHLRSAISIGQKLKDSVSKLQDIQEESCVDDWDGYEGKAVSVAALQDAEIFLTLLPSTIPEPEISAEPDGEISLEWIKNRRNILSLSFGGNNNISYAGVFGASEVYGKEQFLDLIPAAIMDSLKRLYY